MNATIPNLDQQSAGGLLASAHAYWGGKLAFATSFGAEDQVILDLIARHVYNNGGSLPVFTLDTGRLFPETLDVWAATEEKYGIRIIPYHPQREELEAYAAEYGAADYRRSKEARHACCAARKLGALQRALQGREAWICGLRREQNITRADVGAIEWDAAHGLYKINPLRDWGTEDVWRYIACYDVPYNTLHDKGYPSIGCCCCTRAVKCTEDLRAGRWWWEEKEHRECGLHARPRQ